MPDLPRPSALSSEFFWLFVRRDLSMRYAGSALGAAWNLIHPLVMIGIYILVFSTLMSGGSGQRSGLGYGVHLCAGLIPWMAFTDVLLRSLGVLIENGSFIKKTAFPPAVLFLAVYFNSMLIYGGGWLGFMLLMALVGPALPMSALGGLATMALLAGAGLGLGMGLAVLHVFLRDTAPAVNVGLQILFWLNPIVYYRDLIPAFDPAAAPADLTGLERFGRALMAANPFERFISATQWLAGQGRQPSVADWAVAVVFPAVCLAAGWLLFKRYAPDIADSL